MKTSTIKRARQRGASLVMSLIILVVLMMLGVSALMVSNTQTKLAGNITVQSLATAAAESALAQAENWIAKPENTISLGDFNSTGTTPPGLYAKDSGVNPLTMTWTNNNSIPCTNTTYFGTACTADPGISTSLDPNQVPQRYIIEVYAENRALPGNSGGTCGYGMPGPCPNVNLFKTTARGVSRLGANKFVQSLFAVRTGG